MPQKQKISTEEKAKVIENYINNRVSLSEAARRGGVARDTFSRARSKDFVADENGQIHIDGLCIGDYVISEVSNKANEKYELPANVTVTVHEGKTVVAKFHNKLKPVTDIPKTGDTTNIPLWGALAGISAVGAGAAAFVTFRKKKEVGKVETL